MLVCPVCKYHHQEKVTICERCSWSIQNDLEISPEHPILATCVPTLVESLTNKIAQYEKLSSILQDIDLQGSNNRKLDEIQEQFVDIKEMIDDKIVKKLDLLVQDKEPSSDVVSKEKVDQLSLDNNSGSSTEIENTAIEDNSESLTQDYIEQSNSVSLPSFINNNSNNNLQFLNSDRHINNDFNSIDESSEDSLYNSPSDPLREDASPNHEHIDINSLENTEPETNSQDNYQGFYRLIEQQEIEVTRVTVTKETMEKMRGGTLSQLKFENDRKGNYWIIDWQNVYCLIPKRNLNINPYQYGNFQRIFNCQDYQETYESFEVIEPATVVSCDSRREYASRNREIWQLERKGKIKFI